MPNILIQPADSLAEITKKLKPAAQALKAGQLIAFPTETVYGLGANALDPVAVQKIFTAKGRPSDNPLIVHVASIEQIVPLVTQLPSLAHALMELFWPGPLTLVLPKSEMVPLTVTGGGPTVAVRMPNHPVARQLIQAAGVPVAAPSANTSGWPSPTTAQHVDQDLGEHIAYLIDAGPTAIGVESTVLDLTTSVPTLLRSGGVSLEELEAVVGMVNVAETAGLDEPAKSPGQKYRHYAPQAEVQIVTTVTPEMIVKHQQTGKRVGVVGVNLSVKEIISAEFTRDFTSVEALAKHLFSALRQADEQHIDLIVFEAVPKVGLGRAVMNRVERASQAT